MAKKNKKENRILYSTDPNFDYSVFDESAAEDQVAPGQQDLRIWLERHGGGKVVTLIKGYTGAESDMKALGSALKSLCGVGGTAKNGEILIQGDHREKVLAYLKKEGYGAKKAGG
jgi:translation initiation factor 1